MTTPAPALVLLPVVRGAVVSRTIGDRLEILTTLMAAPAFDPVFRTEIICLPADHPAYGWICGIPNCERSRGPQVDYCATHNTQWRKARGRRA